MGQRIVIAGGGTLTANCFVESCFEEVDKLQFQPLYWHDVLR